MAKLRLKRLTLIFSACMGKTSWNQREEVFLANLQLERRVEIMIKKRNFWLIKVISTNLINNNTSKQMINNSWKKSKELNINLEKDRK